MSVAPVGLCVVPTVVLCVVLVVLCAVGDTELLDSVQAVVLC